MRARGERGVRSPLLARLSDRLLATRDGLVGNLAFQRTVSRLPVVRRLAQKQAAGAFDLCAGFVYSQVLLALVELDLFAKLSANPMTIGDIAAASGLHHDPARRLIKAAEALGLVSERSGARYGLGLKGAAIAANPGLLQMIAHHRVLYDDLADPVALLRRCGGDNMPSTGLSKFWAYEAALQADGEDGACRRYSDLMSQSQSLVADLLLDAYPFNRHACMLDVGGGDGTFITRVAARCPTLHFQHFDLPAVSARAGAKFRARDLDNRAITFPGSFLDEALPKGADLVTLVRVIHDHDDGAVKKILERVRAAIVPGGVVLIGEPMAGTRGAEAMGEAYFGFYLMAMGRGRARTSRELMALLRAAGFHSPREVPTCIPLQTRLITAQA